MGRPPKDGKHRPCRLRAHVTQEVYDATEDLRERNEFSAYLDDLLRADLIESRSVDERELRQEIRELEDLLDPYQNRLETLRAQLRSHEKHQLKIEHWEEKRDEFRAMVAEHAKHQPSPRQWREWATARARKVGLDEAEALRLVEEETGIEVTA